MWLAGLLVPWHLHEEGIAEAPSRWAAYFPALIPLPIMWKCLFPKVSFERSPAEGPRNTGLSSMNMVLGFEIWDLEFGALRSMLEIEPRFTWAGAIIRFVYGNGAAIGLGIIVFSRSMEYMWYIGRCTGNARHIKRSTLNWLSATPWLEVVWHLILSKWRTCYMFYCMYFYKNSLVRHSREIHSLPRACFTKLYRSHMDSKRTVCTWPDTIVG